MGCVATAHWAVVLDSRVAQVFGAEVSTVAQYVTRPWWHPLSMQRYAGQEEVRGAFELSRPFGGEWWCDQTLEAAPKPVSDGQGATAEDFWKCVCRVARRVPSQIQHGSVLLCSTAVCNMCRLPACGILRRYSPSEPAQQNSGKHMGSPWRGPATRLRVNRGAVVRNGGGAGGRHNPFGPRCESVASAARVIHGPRTEHPIPRVGARLHLERVWPCLRRQPRARKFTMAYNPHHLTAL